MKKTGNKTKPNKCLTFLAGILIFLLVSSCSKDNHKTVKYTLTVDPEPTYGTLTSSPGSINCRSKGDACNAQFDKGSEVTLTIEADAGYELGAWGGACKSANSKKTCVLNMDKDKTVSKTFSRIEGVLRTIRHTLTVTKPENGTLSSNIGDINCGSKVSDCNAQFDKGTEVTLTATADKGYGPGDWEGDDACTGSGSICTLSMDTDKTVGKIFFRVVSLTLLESKTLVVQKHLIRSPGRYLQSYPGQMLPVGMVVQGMEVHYTASLPPDSALDPGSTTYTYKFMRKQGNVSFLPRNADDDDNTATNRFRADWYGENVIRITAKDAEGNQAKLLDRVFVDFASRRVLGGDAEKLPGVDPLQNAYTVSIRGMSHDIRKDIGERGMAYLPSNHRDTSRVDTSSHYLVEGFYLSKEPRLLKTSKGTLIVTSHAGGRAPRLDGYTIRSEAPPGTGIVMSRSSDHGNTWNDILLAQHQRETWAYTGMVEVDGVIYIYISTAGHPSINDHIARGVRVNQPPQRRGFYYFKSKDDGKSWSQPIKHEGLSRGMGYNVVNVPSVRSGRPIRSHVKYGIPIGSQPSTNILKVPGLTLDGKVAGSGQGLLLHTYPHGYFWASIDGGTNWKKVADWIPYTDRKTNGGAVIGLWDEVAWTVLDNDDQDIYMAFKKGWGRGAGYYDEYVISRTFSTKTRASTSYTGRADWAAFRSFDEVGLTFKAVHNQALGNLPNQSSHHWMTTIRTGPHRGKLLYSTPGAYERIHVSLFVSKAIQGKDTVTTNLFEKARVLQNAGWGYSTVEYLEAGLMNTQGMGKDAIVMVGEGEPIHKETHQLIDFKPDGRFSNERFTTTSYVLSMDYLYTLLAQGKLTVSDSSVQVGENNGRASYTVMLASMPLGNVMVMLASGDTSVATVSPTRLKFKLRNWNIPQMVTVTGVNDDLDNAGDERMTTITHTVVWEGHKGIAADVNIPVTATDDDGL